MCQAGPQSRSSSRIPTEIPSSCSNRLDHRPWARIHHAGDGHQQRCRMEGGVV